MSFNPQVQHCALSATDPRPSTLSLREEAAARAATYSRGPTFTPTSTWSSSFVPPQHPLAPWLQQQQQQQQQQHQQPPKNEDQQHRPQSASSAPATVEEARRRWRTHGSDASQSLEDRRSRLLVTAGGAHSAASPMTTAMSSYPSGAASAAVAAHGGGAIGIAFAAAGGRGGGAFEAGAVAGSVPPSPPPQSHAGGPARGGGSGSFGPCYSVRVLSAEERADISGSGYTSYVLSVETTNPASRSVIEHRYSEFARLHRELDANGASMGSKFPSKISVFGRMGNWTPSSRFAPERQRDLVEYRKTKLDVWLVELCELLNRGEVLGGVRDQCEEFLRVSGAARPPCDRANPVSWDGLERSACRGGGEVGGAPASADEDGTPLGSRHASGAEKYISNPLSFTLGSSIRQAAYTVMHMCGSKSTWSSSDQSIPLDLLHQAKGLCFLTVVKAGLVVSGRVGTGLIVARSVDGGWSPPSAVGTVGVGWGALIGGDITTYLIVLNTDSAVRAFAGDKGTVNLGAELGVAVGPVGRGATGNLGAGDGGVAPAYSYAHSKGLFAGISLEGSVLATRTDVNAKFYGRDMDARSLLFGNVRPRPRAAAPLYDALDEAMGVKMPEGGFRPSRMFEKGPTRCGKYGQGPVGIVSPHPLLYGGASGGNGGGGGMQTAMPSAPYGHYQVQQQQQQQQQQHHQQPHVQQGSYAPSSNSYGGRPR